MRWTGTPGNPWVEFHRGGISPQDAFLPIIRRDEMMLDPDLSRFVQDAAAGASGGGIDYARLGREVAQALREAPPVVDVDRVISKSRQALKAYR